MPATAEAANNTDKRVVFKSCAPFTDCIRKTNNTQVDNAKDIDVVMFMYNFIEYSDIYLKTSGNLWQYCRNVPSSVNNNINFPAKNNGNNNNNSISFKFKEKITWSTGNYDTKDVNIMLPFKCLSNFWRTLEMLLIVIIVTIIQKLATGEGDDYTTACLLDYPYFKENYRLIAIDLSKHQTLQANWKSLQQISFTENLDKDGKLESNATNEALLVFSQGIVRVLSTYLF